MANDHRDFPILVSSMTLRLGFCLYSNSKCEMRRDILSPLSISSLGVFLLAILCRPLEILLMVSFAFLWVLLSFLCRTLFFVEPLFLECELLSRLESKLSSWCSSICFSLPLSNFCLFLWCYSSSFRRRLALRMLNSSLLEWLVIRFSFEGGFLECTWPLC